MSDFDYRLGRLQGQLDSFIYVNAKTNHSYTFEITQIDNSLELVEDTHNFLVKHYPNSQLSTNKIENWQSTVSMVLQRWLFDFVFMGENFDKHNKLHGFGAYSGFNCFESYSRAIFTLEFCQAIDDLLQVIEVIGVNLDTTEWYESCWNDFSFRGKNGSLFLHLGVSD